MSTENEHEHRQARANAANEESNQKPNKVPDDAVGRELHGLPARDVDAATAERIRRAAVDAFAEGHALRGRPWRAMAIRTARALPPLVVVGTVGIYLAWAISTANALFGGH